MRKWFLGLCLIPHSPVVAVLDSGLDITTTPPARLWTNPREIPGNGIDDDGNGVVDDVHGWNFLDDTPDLADHSGHGTHVAGLIRRYAGPSAPRLMILKYIDGGGADPRSGPSFARALDYALRMGADVINVSGGGGRRPGEFALLKKAALKRIPVIAASGNKTPGEKSRPFFPAAYGLRNVFSVAATDGRGRVLPTTNLNPARENFFEIGLNVFSLLPGGRTGALTGTSQAAGVFTGKLLARRAWTCGAD